MFLQTYGIVSNRRMRKNRIVSGFGGHMSRFITGKREIASIIMICLLLIFRREPNKVQHTILYNMASDVAVERRKRRE